jgi:DNA primase
MQSNDTTKYLIHAEITAEGVVERPDVVGAIFGQTEGLLGDELDLRDLQKTGRIGRIEVHIESKSGRSSGKILIPSSLDKVETAILAASLETIDRVGPCVAKISVSKIEDVRASKRQKIIERAKEILTNLFEETLLESQEIAEEVKKAVRAEEITQYGPERLPAGPSIDDSDAIIVVEGRADVLTLLKHGIKNVIAVEGTNIPKTISDLSREKTVTVFLDGDRGGELILKELLQVAEIDYVARAPDGKGVEDLTYKEIIKSLRNKIPAEQVHVLKDKFRKSNKKKDKEKKKQKEDLISGLKQQLKELEGSLSARILGADLEVIKEVPVRDLARELKNVNDGAEGVVFDGVITQRIVDIAAHKQLDYVVGVKRGSVTKLPLNLKIYTAGDF